MKTMLKPWDEVDERNVSRMVGKAMCAYANWMTAIDKKNDERAEFWTVGQQVAQERLIAMYSSEYEATVRCIEMFVREDIYEVQLVIRHRAETELLAS